MKTATKLWIGIGLLALLSPLGLLLPRFFKSGDAWGEWDMFPAVWSAPLPDYGFRGSQGRSLTHLSLEYLFSGIVGIAAVVLAAMVLGKLLAKRGDR